MDYVLMEVWFRWIFSFLFLWGETVGEQAVNLTTALSNNTPSAVIQEDKVKNPRMEMFFFSAAAACAQVWPAMLACCARPEFSGS